jgi:hypothetical protein
MNVKRKINVLWEQFQFSITKAYMEGSKQYDHPANALRDHARNIGYQDALGRLLGRETAHERRHRSNRPSDAIPSAFHLGTAAKLLIMENARMGTEVKDMPPATTFLTCRDSAAEAYLIGWLTRDYLDVAWRNQVKALDYADLMKK